MQPQLDKIREKLGHLSIDRLSEVDDFIDFLQQREQDNHLRQNYARASEAVFAQVWDNDDDAAYDQL